MDYLTESLHVINDNNHLIETARNYRLLGIINMRNNQIDRANINFETALHILSKLENANSKIAHANTYSGMAFNYLIKDINKGDVIKSVEIMKEAIKQLERTSKTGMPIISSRMLKPKVNTYHQQELQGQSSWLYLKN